MNEGLADELASELIPNPRRVRMVSELARTGLEKHGNQPGDFFSARHIDGWQYPVAETLCAWMIRKNRDGYLDFINAVKAGQPWERSLKDNFGADPAGMIADYRKSLQKKPGK